MSSPTRSFQAASSRRKTGPGRPVPMPRPSKRVAGRRQLGVLESRISSAAADALAGVSLRYTQLLAESLGLSWQTRSLTEADLAAADEILLSSTPNCLLPATRFDGRGIGTGLPGPVFRRLLAAWSDRVGLDIAAQARMRARHGSGGA
ncbi:MAG: hypothetical protein ACKOWG_17655 [Planctomycetia bacterium]